ncbi:hypothetical protein BJX70DRAFT_396800 [Aspergillus crustosus]
MAEKPNSHPLVVGVLLVSDLVQLLDLAPIDVLTTLQPEYLVTCGLSDEIVAQAVSIDIHYITEDGTTSVAMTSGVKNPALYILFIPGPHPLYEPSTVVGFL